MQRSQRAVASLAIPASLREAGLRRLQAASAAHEYSYCSEDAQEGPRPFAEKRKPRDTVQESVASLANDSSPPGVKSKRPCVAPVIKGLLESHETEGKVVRLPNEIGTVQAVS
ncbi:hypothetical protein QT386_12270 [Solimonas sp. SE-A11]|nr:hypothetical protein [Solimonas sp. SE-A11]MDM4770975.1 hypothetical protein [Solimonas sp. SE-A11]